MEDGIKSPFKKFYTDETFEKIKQACHAKTEICCWSLRIGRWCTGAKARCALRCGPPGEISSIRSSFASLWVVDFPMFEYSEEEKRWKAM